jgi:hypothetical protein
MGPVSEASCIWNIPETKPNRIFMQWIIHCHAHFNKFAFSSHVYISGLSPFSVPSCSYFLISFFTICFHFYRISCCLFPFISLFLSFLLSNELNSFPLIAEIHDLGNILWSTANRKTLHVSSGLHPVEILGLSFSFGFFFLNLHSGGWNQGPLDTAAT